LSRYFGPDVDIDPYMKWEWARIPHFYSAFYVFKYATGFSAAAAISRAVLEKGAPVVERYLEFLGAGGSDYPADTLRRAGVDMTTPASVEAAMVEFAALVDELEVLLVG
jgi:oligoendopeptidase F